MKNTDFPENDPDSLITSYLSGNASHDEILLLSAWVDQSEKNRQYFRSFCDIWHLSAGLQHTETGKNDSALDKINSRLENLNIIGKENQRKLRTFTFFKYAASVLVILAAGYFIGKITSNSALKLNNSGMLAVVYAPMGSKAMGVLPDGTQVWLNAGSKIEYNTHDYDVSLRQVVLTGEAYFKVKTNPEKPFVVKAKGINVKAIGTEFNVKAYPEENLVVTTLVKGIVKIEGKDKDRKNFVLEMKPRQIVSLKAPVVTPEVINQNVPVSGAKQKLEIRSGDQSISKQETPLITNNVNTYKYTSWKDNQWVLEGEDIGNLVIMLERKFNVKITVESQELKKYKFTGTFRNETLEQVLSVLKIATPMQYNIGKGTVTLKIDPVLKDKYRKFITE